MTITKMNLHRKNTKNKIKKNKKGLVVRDEDISFMSVMDTSMDINQTMSPQQRTIL